MRKCRKIVQTIPSEGMKFDAFKTKRYRIINDQEDKAGGMLNKS